MNKINFHIHINEIEWQDLPEEKWGSLRWKELLNRTQGGSKEFLFGLAELPAGRRLLLHTHQQAETDYILSGKAMARLGAWSVELGPSSALYFPGGRPHSIETLGSEPLRYICTYACEKLGHEINLEFAEEATAKQLIIRNKVDTRWAIREEIEPFGSTEPSKGFRVRTRHLFDQKLGHAQDMMVGIGEIDPGIHYTLHYHDQPEIYYILSGRGVIYVGDSAFDVSPGSTLYIGARVIHGADSLGEGPLRLYYIYGAETAGQKHSWMAVEDIYTEVRSRK